MALTKLDLSILKREARLFLTNLSKTPIKDLYGTSDGKAVGTYIEHAFQAHLEKKYTYERGSSASGIDFPALNVDLKVTSIQQPQSSCPYRDATQKIYGLGYHLLVFVYEKTDDESKKAANMRFLHAVFVDQSRTADYQTTKGMCDILDRAGNKDDIIAFLIERSLPLDEIGRDKLADKILKARPKLGYLTSCHCFWGRNDITRDVEIKHAREIEYLIGVDKPLPVLA
jgi:restriction system protein